MMTCDLSARAGWPACGEVWRLLHRSLPMGLGVRSYAVRLALATSLLVVVVTGAQSWLLARHDLAHVRGYLGDRGRTLAERLAQDAARPLRDGDLEAIERLAEQTRAASGVLYVRVRDRQGLLVAGIGQVGEATGAWEFDAPVGAGAADLGTVVLGLSLEPLEALGRRRLAIASLLMLVSILIGVLGAGLIARAVTRPLRALADAADRISRGDFAARVDADREDEIGRLAGSFNAMAESLARNRAALEQKVRELEQADHLKSEFLATVSHELRTPLNVILGYTEMLSDGGGGAVNSTQAEMLATIQRYSQNQLELITSVLDFTRLSSGVVSLKIERFALEPLLAEIRTIYGTRLRSPGVTLTVAVDPQAAEVETDRIKLQEIVRNLVDNAVKFTQDGAIAIRARPADPGWVAIDVADSGPGIPSEDLEAVFEAFRQLGASSTRQTGGVGLGLSIVRQLVSALGGRVSATSMPGEGSLFTVLLPCAVAAASAALDATARNAENAAALRAVPAVLRV